MTRYQGFLYLVQFTMAAMCAWSCFCRLVRTNRETIREIRWAIVLQATACGLLMGAPILPLTVPELAKAWRPWTTPAWVYVLGVIAMTLMQLVTARHWKDGVPADFQRRIMTPPKLWNPFVVVAVALGGLLFAWKVYAAPSAEAPPTESEPVAGPVIKLDNGEWVRCIHPEGCVAMTLPAAREFAAAAKRGCGRSI